MTNSNSSSGISPEPPAADRLARAWARFDEFNARDPNQESVAGVPRPRELLQAERLTAWVLALCPDASEVLRLAARCQHLGRWTIPRANYPATKPGYLRWRADLRRFHAAQSGTILREAGCDEPTIARVQALNLKSNFPADPESRVLEDALCLVFLEFQFTELATRTEEDKLVNALRKSWQKMTPAAHAHALRLPFGTQERSLLERALSTPPPPPG